MSKVLAMIQEISVGDDGVLIDLDVNVIDTTLVTQLGESEFESTVLIPSGTGAGFYAGQMKSQVVSDLTTEGGTLVANDVIIPAFGSDGGALIEPPELIVQLYNGNDETIRSPAPIPPQIYQIDERLQASVSLLGSSYTHVDFVIRATRQGSNLLRYRLYHFTDVDADVLFSTPATWAAADNVTNQIPTNVADGKHIRTMTLPPTATSVTQVKFVLAVIKNSGVVLPDFTKAGRYSKVYLRFYTP